MPPRTSASRLSAQPSGVTLAYGVITSAPATAGDTLRFAYKNRPDHQITTVFWSPRGALLPEVGDRCIIAVAPTVDPFVQHWSPNA